MAGINKVILVGNVGRVETKSTPAGNIVNISLATSYKNKEKQDVTEWHNCVFFGKVADVAANYVTKGMKLYVEGMLKTDKWQTEAGETRYATKVMVRDMQMLDSKESASQSNGGPSNGNTAPLPYPAPLPTAPLPTYSGAPLEDDIPF